LEEGGEIIGYTIEKHTEHEIFSEISWKKSKISEDL
jgi:hypothetical protein